MALLSLQLAMRTLSLLRANMFVCLTNAVNLMDGTELVGHCWLLESHRLLEDIQLLNEV